MTTIDRRVTRTRAALQKAHLSLILEKGYEATTVDDICRLANVGRSTFYAHFTNKEDLRRSGLEQLRQDLRRQAHSASGPDGARPLGFSRSMFEHASDHLDLYRALVGGRGGVIALDAIRGILSELVRGEFAAASRAGAPEEVPRELAVQHVVGAFMSVMTWWLDGGAGLPADQVDAAFRRLAIDGAGGLIAFRP